MPGTADAADLFVVPVVAVLETPMSVGEVRQRLADAGMDASTETVAGLLARSADLGLTRVAEHRGGEARYVATSLGQRSAAHSGRRRSRREHRPGGARAAAERPARHRRP